MKFSHYVLFNLEYMLSWFVVRVLSLNIRWCVDIYKDYQVIVYGIRSAETGKRDGMYHVLERMAEDADERRQRSRSRSRSTR